MACIFISQIVYLNQLQNSKQTLNIKTFRCQVIKGVYLFLQMKKRKLRVSLLTKGHSENKVAFSTKKSAGRS